MPTVSAARSAALLIYPTLPSEPTGPACRASSACEPCMPPASLRPPSHQSQPLRGNPSFGAGKSGIQRSPSSSRPQPTAPQIQIRIFVVRAAALAPENYATWFPPRSRLVDLGDLHTYSPSLLPPLVLLNAPPPRITLRARSRRPFHNYRGRATASHPASLVPYPSRLRVNLSCTGRVLMPTNSGRPLKCPTAIYSSIYPLPFFRRVLRGILAGRRNF
jgi:hypothetical protein